MHVQDAEEELKHCLPLASREFRISGNPFLSSLAVKLSFWSDMND